jgi:small subunit ribosomal protein S6
MNNYEMLCVLPGTLAEDEVTPVVEKIKETLSNKEVQNLSVKDMGKSKLAYPIKHIRYGYFQLFHFDLDSEELQSLEKDVRLLSNIIRIVVKKYNPETAKDYVLATDPTALSAKEKPEEKRERRPFRKPAYEIRKKEEESKKVEEIKEEKPIEVKTEDKKEETKKIKIKKEEKISIDDIDKKLEEILKKDIDNV